MSRGLTFERVAEEVSREIFLSLQFDTPEEKNYEIFNPDITDAESDWAQRQIVVVLCKNKQRIKDFFFKQNEKKSEESDDFVIEERRTRELEFQRSNRKAFRNHGNLMLCFE